VAPIHHNYGNYSHYNHNYHNGYNYRGYPFLGGYGYYSTPAITNYVTPYYYPYDSSYSYYQPYTYDEPAYPQVVPMMPTVPTESVAQEARIEILVPTPNTQLWVEDYQTTTGGMRRSFLTPALSPGTYVYHVRAVWNQDGQTASAERTITVQPGQAYTVDFTRGNTADQLP